MKFKITVYFVYIKRKIEMHLAYSKKSGAVFLYFESFYSFLADNIYMSFVIIYDNLLKYVALTAQLLQ